MLQSLQVEGLKGGEGGRYPLGRSPAWPPPGPPGMKAGGGGHTRETCHQLGAAFCQHVDTCLAVSPKVKNIIIFIFSMHRLLHSMKTVYRYYCYYY